MLTTVLFWAITQYILVIPIPDVTPENGTDMLSRNVGNELQPLAA
jgi:hypothetical protein